MPTWKISKIITDLLWETLRDQLQTKLKKAVENKEQWDDVSERVRQSLLGHLNRKNASLGQKKKCKSVRQKQIKSA